MDSRYRSGEVQILGMKESADTRKALRFFSERRIGTHFVDFAVRNPAPGELRRFAARFGTEALIDQHGKRYAELGLDASARNDAWWERCLVQDPVLIRVPLVRFGNYLTIGLAEKDWREWVERSRRP